MKNIKDLENMSLETLEAIAEDKSVEVPGDIRERILEIASAGAIAEEESVMAMKNAKRMMRFIPYAAAVAAAAASLLILPAAPKEPEDTFDDPLLAYAELERTFSYISSKMDRGLEIASAAEPVFEKTSAVLNSTGRKK